MIATPSGPCPEVAFLKPRNVREDMSPIGGVTVMVVDPGDFDGDYEAIVHRWQNFQIEVRSSREKLPENGIVIWEPGSDWEGKLETLSQESARKNTPNFDTVRSAWNAIRTAIPLKPFFTQRSLTGLGSCWKFMTAAFRGS